MAAKLWHEAPPGPPPSTRPRLGPRGRTRNPRLVAVLSVLVPGYFFWWLHGQVFRELARHLERDPAARMHRRAFFLAVATLGLAIPFQIAEVADLIAEAAERSGRPRRSPRGIFLFVLFAFPPALPAVIQHALNDLWRRKSLSRW
jgi:hypothetical protein